MVTSSTPARADTTLGWNEDGSDVVYAMMPDGQDPGKCPDVQDSDQNIIQDVLYSSFAWAPPGEPLANWPLRLDVYLPPEAGTYAAMLYVHGGSLTSGCRDTDSDIAEEMSGFGSSEGTPFIVVTVDYRLRASCVAGDPAADAYCGSCSWQANASTFCNAGQGLIGCSPPGTDCAGPILQDVADAAAWIPAHLHQVINDHGHGRYSFTGNSVIQGASAGATLVYSLASHFPDELSGAGVKAAGGWSGGINEDYWHSTTDPRYAEGTLVCNTGANPTGCHEKDFEKFDCESPDDYGHQPCMGYISDASSYNAWKADYYKNPTAPPVVPVFVANSDCEVPGSEHATAYLANESCDNAPGQDVLATTLSFMAAKAYS